MVLVNLYYALISLIETNLAFSFTALVLAFIILAKCADLFVDSSVEIAAKFKVPKLVIGIVLVSFATTAPELAVSLMSALSGQPEMALGNAIGSVICDDGLALALAGLAAASPIVISRRIFKTSGIFLLGIECISFLFVLFDNTLNRWEGIVLVSLFIGYIILLYRQHKQGKLQGDIEEELLQREPSSTVKLSMFFIISLSGIILSSKLIVVSATSIAYAFHIPESIIALTIVAFGTSIPEVATCVIAARKRHGAIAVGNIIGADIMNICWVAGASAIANPLVLGLKETWFMFPAMFVVVGTMLLMLRINYSLNRVKGAILLAIYAIYLYLALFVMKFPINY